MQHDANKFPFAATFAHHLGGDLAAKELARFADVTDHTIRNWAGAETNPGADDIQRILANPATPAGLALDLLRVMAGSRYRVELCDVECNSTPVLVQAMELTRETADVPLVIAEVCRDNHVTATEYLRVSEAVNRPVERARRVLKSVMAKMGGRRVSV